MVIKLSPGKQLAILFKLFISHDLPKLYKILSSHKKSCFFNGEGNAL
jgi:hypothetical protein